MSIAEIAPPDILDHPDIQDISFGSPILESWLPRNEQRIIARIGDVALNHIRANGMHNFPPELQTNCLRTELEDLRKRQNYGQPNLLTVEQRTFLAQLGHALTWMDDVGQIEPPLDVTERLQFGIFHAAHGVLPEVDDV